MGGYRIVLLPQLVKNPNFSTAACSTQNVTAARGEDGRRSAAAATVSPSSNSHTIHHCCCLPRRKPPLVRGRSGWLGRRGQLPLLRVGNRLWSQLSTAPDAPPSGRCCLSFSAAISVKFPKAKSSSQIPILLLLLYCGCLVKSRWRV